MKCMIIEVYKTQIFAQEQTHKNGKAIPQRLK